MVTDRKILVVDDNDLIRTVVSATLSLVPLRRVVSRQRRKWNKPFSQNRFDIVLADYQMPVMDGVDFACSIKECSPRTPVVIMTGAAKESVLSRKSTAVDEVIAKPFTLEQIGATIENWTKALFA